MKKVITKAGCNTMIMLINLQLRNKHLAPWARKELEDDRAEFEKILKGYRRRN